MNTFHTYKSQIFLRHWIQLYITVMYVFKMIQDFVSSFYKTGARFHIFPTFHFSIHFLLFHFHSWQIQSADTFFLIPIYIRLFYQIANETNPDHDIHRVRKKKHVNVHILYCFFFSFPSCSKQKNIHNIKRYVLSLCQFSC